MKLLAKKIKGQFEALKFANEKHGEKVCYLRLSKNLDPRQVVERIQNMTKFGAYIPDYVPDVSSSFLIDGLHYTVEAQNLAMPTPTLVAANSLFKVIQIGHCNLCPGRILSRGRTEHPHCLSALNAQRIDTFHKTFLAPQSLSHRNVIVHRVPIVNSHFGCFA